MSIGYFFSLVGYIKDKTSPASEREFERSFGGRRWWTRAYCRSDNSWTIFLHLICCYNIRCNRYSEGICFCRRSYFEANIIVNAFTILSSCSFCWAWEYISIILLVTTFFQLQKNLLSIFELSLAYCLMMTQLEQQTRLLLENVGKSLTLWFTKSFSTSVSVFVKITLLTFSIECNVLVFVGGLLSLNSIFNLVNATIWSVILCKPEDVNPLLYVPSVLAVKLELY